MSAKERFVAQVRKVAREEARRISPPIERWRVAKLKPFTLEDFGSDLRAVDADDDFDIARSIRTPAKIGDMVLVGTDEDGDKFAIALLRTLTEEEEEGDGGDVVVSVFGRKGAVVAKSGDYTVAQITDAASQAEVAAEAAAREAAVKAEKEGREAADGVEKAAREAAVKAEKEGREAADVLLASKAEVAALLAAADAMVFKGVIDCSANPNYPAADAGHTYRVSVAGKIGGAAGPNVEVGDLLLCIKDGTAAGNHATVGANWSITQTNIEGAVTGPAVSLNGRIAVFSGVSGKVITDGGTTLATILNSLAEEAEIREEEDAALSSAMIPKTVVDAKGDVLAATANDAIARVAVGADAQVLTADSTQATGVKWAAAPASGAPVIAHDAASNVAAGTGNLEWEHKPAATLPRGILVLVAQNVTNVNQVSEVTYGGVKMEAVPLSPVLHVTGTEDGVLTGYFLGKGIPAGNQIVKVTVSGAQSKRAVAFSMTAPGNLRVIDTTILDSGGVANPSVAMTTATDEETALYGLLHSGQNEPAGVTAAAGFTEVLEHDFGEQVASWIRKTENGTGGAINIAWTATSEEAGAIGVAIGLVRDHGHVAALPTVAGKGDTCHYEADKTNGIIWELLYDGEGEFPWKKIGGQPLTAEVETAQSTSSTSYTNLTTTGPSITTPLKGDWLIAINCRNWNSNALQSCFMSYSIGAAAATDADSAGNSTPVNSGALQAGRRKRKTEIAASSAIVAKYRVDGGTGNFEKRWLEIDPIRVG